MLRRSRSRVETMTGKTCSLNIIEVKSPDTCAQLVAENIAAAAGKARIFPPRHEAGARPRDARLAPRVSRPRCPVVWAAQKSPAARATMTVPSRCRPCAPTSITAFAEAHTSLRPHRRQGLDLPRDRCCPRLKSRFLSRQKEEDRANVDAQESKAPQGVCAAA